MSAQLEDGYTRIANEIMEAMCRLKCSNYESRLLWALFRKTYGFHKKEDFISLTQLSEMTGILSQHIARAKKNLIKTKVILVNGNKIGLNKNILSWVVPNEVVPNEVVPNEVVPNEVIGSTYSGSQVVPIQVLTKETLTKETIQKKPTRSIYDLNDSDFEVIASKYNVPIAMVRSSYDDMVNWHEGSGKQKKDWVATLRGFVKRDALKITKEHYGKSKIANIPL